MTAPKWLKLLEKIALFLAILSFWPVILARKYAFLRHPGWHAFMYVMLLIMVGIFIFNAVRLWRMGHPPGEDDDSTP